MSRLFIFILLIGIFASGCEGTIKIPLLNTEEDPLMKYETRVRVYSLLPEEEFDAKIKRPLEEKYPKLDLMQVTSPYWWRPINGYADIADIVIHHDVFPYWQWNGTGTNQYPMIDLRSLMQKYNVKESDFDPALMAYIKSFGANGEIFALPVSRKLNALYYNKDIFDKLGVPYPSNGMTWNEVMGLAQELTREIEGVKYHGLEPVELPLLTNQLALRYVDPSDERVMILDPEWKLVWDLWKQMHDVSQVKHIFINDLSSKARKYWGGYPRDIGGVFYSFGVPEYHEHLYFEKGWFRDYNESKLNYIIENNFAMTTGFDLDTLALARKAGHNFDIVALPTFEQNKLQEPANILGDMIMINSIPKGDPPSTILQDVAFRIAMELLTEEAQETRYYDGVYPSLKEFRFSSPFASNIESLKDAALSSFLYNEMPNSFPQQRSKHDQEAYGVIMQRSMKFNTYLTDKENQEWDATLADVAKEMARVIAKSPTQ